MRRSAETFEGLDRGLFAKASRRAAFVETAPLVDADIGRNDPHHIEMIVDRRDNAISPGAPRTRVASV